VIRSSIELFVVSLSTSIVVLAGWRYVGIERVA
jgi:hypothetical protein